MTAAEKWYRHREEYNRYGFDMKPKKINPAPVKREQAVTISDMAKLVLLVVLAGLLAILLTITAAYTAGITHEVNNIIDENRRLSGEIENLHVQIKNATNIRHIEDKALNELGMVYPLPEQFVFLTRPENLNGDFAILIKELAFN